MFSDRLTGGELTARLDPLTQDPLPLQRVRWRVEDALPFAVCLSNETAQAGLVRNVSVVRGNVAPADHGRTVRRDGLTVEPGTGRWPLATLRLARFASYASTASGRSMPPASLSLTLTLKPYPEPEPEPESEP